MSNIRSAEKARVSTCALADAVANSVINEFKTVYSQPGMECSSQGVLAGIVAMNTEASSIEQSLTVISLGLGNKFIDASGSIRDEPLEEADTAGRLRDMHAEVLARRAFKRWLLKEWLKLVNPNSTNTASPLLQIDSNTVTLKPNFQLILYVSSCPCGNACIRRWATAKHEIPHEELSESIVSLPSLPHPIFHPHAKLEGQTKLSFKGLSNPSTILTCSDKILKWNVLGLQGYGLSGIVTAPIKLSGIVVGRKFVRAHAERAFCCRLNSKHISQIVRQHVAHPALMCSAVKFDDGTYEENHGATFSQKTFWWTNNGESEHIDGATGYTIGGTGSLLSRTALLDRCVPRPGEPWVQLKIALESELKAL